MPPAPTCTVPALIVVVPVKVLAPLKIWMPVPSLVRAPMALAPVSAMTPEKLAEPAVLKAPAVWLSTPRVREPTPPVKPTVTSPAPVRASTRTLPSTAAKRAPVATFRSAELLVQTSLLLLLPVKMPPWTSIMAPEPRANVATDVPHWALPSPDFTKAPVPRKVVLA